MTMRAWFEAVTPVDPEIAHRFALGGGVAACPDEPSEDHFGWIAENGLLVSAAGMGNADGLAGMYFDAAPLARAFVDSVTSCAPSLALADVVREGARAMAALTAANYQFRFAGTAIEASALHFQPDGRLEVVQAGGQALHRRRGTRTERLIRLGTLGEEFGPQSTPAADWTPIRAITSAGVAFPDPFTCVLDWQPGDRFLLTTRGVRLYVDEEVIGDCLGRDAGAILPALLTEVRRTARRAKQPSAAVLIVEAA
jgi:hypothetical protein